MKKFITLLFLIITIQVSAQRMWVEENYIMVEELNGIIKSYSQTLSIYEELPGQFKISEKNSNQESFIKFAESTIWFNQESTISYTEESIRSFLQKNTGYVDQLHFTNNSVDVIQNDPITPIFDLFFSQPTGAPTTLVNATLVNDKTITVNSIVGFSVGSWVGIFTGAGVPVSRYYWAEVLSISVNDITLDTPLDFDFPIGSLVLPTTRDLSVDGSITPQIFSIQVGNSGLEIDITNIIVSIVTTDPPGLGDFGDRAALENGLVLRFKNGIYRNIWNVKTNYLLTVHSFNLDIYEQIKQSDVNALTARYTAAGVDNHQSVIRIKAGESLELIIQDDLTQFVVMLGVATGSEVSN